MKLISKKLGLVVALVAVIVAAGVAFAVMSYGAPLQYPLQISAKGTILTFGLEVYSDSACTVKLTQIDWGLVSPGETKTTTCYLKSLSTVNATLSMVTGSFVPSGAGSYLGLTWDREGAKILPGQVVSAVFTLKVNSGITGITSFNFVITVTATQA